MKRKIATTLMAATLCTAMLGSTAFASSFDGELNADVLAAGGAEITGDSGLENPVYKIVVPTTLDFAVDPFEQKGQSQVYSKDFYMVNKSNVPVQLDCAVTLTAGTGVTIKDSAADVTETNSDKLIYMEAEIPGAVTETTAAAAAFETPLKKDGTNYYDAGQVPDDVTGASDAEEMLNTTAAAGTYTSSKKVGLGTTEKKLSFALEKADYQEYYTAKDLSTTAKQFKAVAASQKGSSAFRFSGKVNTKATWTASAVTAKVKYTFNGLTGTNYTALTATPDATAHAYVAGNTATACKLQTVSNGSGTDITSAITSSQGIYIKVGSDFLTAEASKLTSVEINGVAMTPSSKDNAASVNNALRFKLASGKTLSVGDEITLVVDGVTYSFTVAS